MHALLAASILLLALAWGIGLSSVGARAGAPETHIVRTGAGTDPAGIVKRGSAAAPLMPRKRGGRTLLASAERSFDPFPLAAALCVEAAPVTGDRSSRPMLPRTDSAGRGSALRNYDAQAPPPSRA